MEELAAFRAALRGGRDSYNARFALARQYARHLDPSAFLAHLRDAVGPAVEAAARAGGDPGRVTDALFDVSLVLARHGYPRVRGTTPPGAGPGWADLMAALAPQLAAEPRRTAVAVTNAWHHLTHTPGARPAQWQAAMTALAACCDPPTLLAAGAVAAWRCGMAHLRPAALRVARSLAHPVLAAALGIPTASESTVDLMVEDPWADPAGGAEPARPRPVARVGAFRGYGGVFGRPPRVASDGAHLYAIDGVTTWRLHADRFGCVFRRAAPDAPLGPGGDRAQAGRTLAVAGRNTHTIELIAL